MKRNIIRNFFGVVLVLIIITSIFLVYKNIDEKEIKLDNVSLKESVSNSFALMLEQTNGTYEETTDTEWPSEGYSFNKHMSGCIDSNGNTIENTLTYKNGTIKLKTKHNTYCYIYFDIDRPATEELLATVPEEQLWDSTLEDDGYRYVGTNPDNYICFGTTDQEECMNDTDKYMYRIIGVFEDSEGVQHLKLIKKEALNTAYVWHSDAYSDIDWDASDLYKGINGSYFATNSEYSYMQDSAWNNIISTWEYTVTNTKTYESSGLDYGSLVILQTYLHEMNRNSKLSSVGAWKTATSKIGLMYASDYQLSLGSISLDYINSNSTHYASMKTGWMHISNNDSEAPTTYELTSSRYGLAGNSWYHVWTIDSSGAIFAGRVAYEERSVRPVFYLEADTKLDKGTGTIDDPYTIETSPNLREYCEEYNNINECIENEENNIEEVSDLWNSTLEEDGIRYVGTNPNNYVCFGTTNEEECTTDTDKYMYRIIGIFEDSEGNHHLKLIKKEALKENMDNNYGYYWNLENDNFDWLENGLSKKINEEYFLTNSKYSYMQTNNWLNKIIEWKYTATNTKTYEKGGVDYHNSATIENIYLHEMNRSTKESIVGEWKTVLSKIGLMYASDYLLSLGKEILQYKSYDNHESLKTGWMHISINDVEVLNQSEWTMTRYGAYSDNSYYACYVDSIGHINWNKVIHTASVRPVFYLTENIKITSGKGSVTEPFIIN